MLCLCGLFFIQLLVLAVSVSLLISMGDDLARSYTHTTDSVGDQDSIFRREKPDEKIQLEVPLNNATT